MSTETQKVELLPCPFCGSDDIVVGSHECRGDGPDQFPQDVVCMNCPAGFCGHDFRGQGTNAVIAAWNSRHVPTQLFEVST